jgi:carbamoyltransferase
MRILGISAFYHDSAAALIEDGHITAAAQEERFTRKKQDSRYPENAIRYCLEEGGLALDELDT